MQRTALAVALLISMSCAGSQGRPEVVSLTRLIVEPEEYDGQVVHVIGFLNIEFEGDALYASEDAYRGSMVNDRIWVDIPSGITNRREMFQHRYVLLKGTFDANDRGHMGMFSGTLRDVTDFTPRIHRSDELACPPEWSFEAVMASDPEHGETRALADSFLDAIRSRQRDSLLEQFPMSQRGRLGDDLERSDSRVRWLLFEWDESLSLRAGSVSDAIVYRLSNPEGGPLSVACFCDGPCAAMQPLCLNELADSPIGDTRFCLAIERGVESWHIEPDYFLEAE